MNILFCFLISVLNADWDFAKIFVDEGIKSANKSVFAPAAKSDIINDLPGSDVVFTVLENGQPSETFKMDNERGELIIRKALDREKQEKYAMTIGAKDLLGGTIEDDIEFEIIVNDLNDERPKFQNDAYTIRLKEHSKLGQVATVASLQEPPYKSIYATDDDKIDRPKESTNCSPGYGNGDLTYVISSKWFDVKTCYDRQVEVYYAVLSVKTKNLTALDRENRPPDLDFTIRANDQGTPHQQSDEIPISVELIDINDHPPRFKDAGKIMQSPGIPEDVPIYSEILKIDIIDEDEGENKKVRLSITEDATATFQAISSEDHSQAIIRNLKPLDYEKMPMHEFLLTAYSKEPVVETKNEATKIRIRIKVTNVDEPPTFASQKLFISENAQPGTTVNNSGNMAVDPEGDKFSYSIENNDVPFDIDPKSGVIKTNQRIDFEAKNSFAITVVGTSVNGLVGKGQVDIKVIDVNDQKPRPVTELLIKYCVNNESWTNSINFTDPDISASPNLIVRKGQSREWKGIDLKTSTSVGSISMTIRAKDIKDIRSGLSLDVVVSDGKYDEAFDISVDKCICNGAGDRASCKPVTAPAPIPKAQMTLAIVIAVVFSLLTIIGFALWRKQRNQKLIKLEIEPDYEMDAEDDERENVMPYSEEAGEEPGPENYNLALLQKETFARNGTIRLPRISEQADQDGFAYSEKLKEKLENVSNPYFIAPYDSLQLYHYEGTNSIFSSLSSLNTIGSEHSLNLADIRDSNKNGKMNKLLKIFEAHDGYTTIPKQSKVSLTLNRDAQTAKISKL